MELYLTKALTTLILPPGGSVSLGILGLLALFRFRRTGIGLLLASVVSLYAFSTPVVADFLSERLEALSPYPLRAPGAEKAQAIVVLGGGRTGFAPEYGGETVSAASLVRLRYAARLHKKTGLPVMVTGGRTFGESLSEAGLMRRVLREDFDTPVRWTEERARTTHENAQHAAAILKDAGIETIFVVSHAIHLRRAVQAFRRAGIEALPAPTGFQKSRSKSLGYLSLLPSANALEDSASVLHEFLGALWYRWRYG